MSQDFDLNGQLKKDKQRVTKLWNGGGGEFSIGGVLEGIFWSGAILTVFGMLLVMPWVGEEGVITGRMWLFGSLGGILFFGGLAFAIKAIRSMDDSGTSRRRGVTARRGR